MPTLRFLAQPSIMRPASSGSPARRVAHSQTSMACFFGAGGYSAIRRYARGEEVCSATLVNVMFPVDEVLPE
jgi:hypothetical protein